MMNTHLFALLFALSVPLYCILDLVWLGLIARNFYQTRLAYHIGDVNWFAAVTFYIIFLLGLTFFATYPAVTKGTMLTALVLGALYGFFTYVTYDLTNLATLKNWPLSLTIVDIAWGTILGASVAVFTAYVYNSYIA